ncbi:hypothetical protein [Nocardia sp. NBC_01327]|uniref:hypothetical protein n=1 Tax=Nocardia sp. NBC_01327 TaxID=2903593 RepID=UPI002E115CF1|nr:class II glutamine amidotransferase [Nocardia sp. NBC_01327]
MCILSFYKPGIAPDLETLRDGAAANPHGHGYAIVADDRILVGRGLNADAVINEFASVRALFPDTPALFHSRFATHGYVSEQNCHPFAFGGDERTVLAHNGVLPEIVHPAFDDPRSDTRVAAEDFLPREPFGPIDSWTGRTGLEDWLNGDKMIILTVDPRYKHTAYLLNEHHGHWSADGIWYSNHSYRWRAPGTTAKPGSYLYDYCDYCGQYDIERAGPHCAACGFCEECWREFPHCDCEFLAGTDRYADLKYFDAA